MEEKIKRLKNGEEILVNKKTSINAISKRLGKTGVIIARRESNCFAVRLATSKEHNRIYEQMTSNNGKEFIKFLKSKIFWEETK